MQTRTIVAIGLLALPAALSAQRTPVLPRGGKDVLPPPPTVGPQGLPPQIPIVARAQAYHQSRWSAEAYSLVSAVRVPSPTGGTSASSSYGLGTHAGYRYTERWSATVDLSASPIGGSASTQTVELGTRFSPLSPAESFRPFFDVRAAYLRMNDNFAAIDGSSSPGGVALQNAQNGSRYGRGMGGVIGVGYEHSLTRSFAFTNEVSVLRDRLSAYRLAGLPGGALNDSYWTTSARFAFGIKYSPVQTLHLAQ